jgi:hypothetical protein
MKWAIIISLVFVAIAVAATRVYDIEPFQNCNGKAREIGQIFVATCDSFLWAEIFIGAANIPGQYHFEISEYQEGTPIAAGNTNAGPGIYYDYVRANLSRVSQEPILKGKTYLLKITHSSGDSINFYYNPNGNVYPYGEIYGPPPQAANGDLAARVEGITRIPQDLFGTEINASC